MTMVKGKILKKGEYIYEDSTLISPILESDEEKTVFKKKISHAEKINDIFDDIKDELSVIINYGCKLEAVKEDFKRKGLA